MDACNVTLHACICKGTSWDNAMRNSSLLRLESGRQSPVLGPFSRELLSQTAKLYTSFTELPGEPRYNPLASYSTALLTLRFVCCPRV